jgi:hypothetical protein
VKLITIDGQDVEVECCWACPVYQSDEVGGSCHHPKIGDGDIPDDVGDPAHPFPDWCPLREAI